LLSQLIEQTTLYLSFWHLKINNIKNIVNIDNNNDENENEANDSILKNLFIEMNSIVVRIIASMKKRKFLKEQLKPNQDNLVKKRQKKFYIISVYF